jgi:hypothetical protein
MLGPPRDCYVDPSSSTRLRMLFHASSSLPKRQTTEETIPMKAIVATDQAAGPTGMKLIERPEPQPAIGDVVVQVHASGFTWDELTWPPTWTDRAFHDRHRRFLGTS